MCCFNRPVEGVSKTRILVLPTKDGRQITVYENTVEVVGSARTEKEKAKKEALVSEKEKEKYENAMILPAPLKAGSTVQLLDLSNDNFSFDRIENFFPKAPKNRSRGSAPSSRLAASHLVIHEIGAYFVSVAENLGDLSRIDPSVFKVSPNIQEVFSNHYSKGFGFVICCFNPNKKIAGHPIAFIHDVMADGKIFVPCRHEHGHGTKKTEKFDHFIYSVNTAAGESGETRDEILAKHPDWEYDKEFVASVAVTSDLMAEYYPTISALRRLRIEGDHKNDDLIFVHA